MPCVEMLRSVDAKVAVLGSQGVGKTSVVVRYVNNTFNNYISPTIGASFFTCRMVIDDCRVKLQLWDTAGQERFRSMAPMYYRNSNAAILVYDITSIESFNGLKTWVTELRNNVDTRLVMCVVGNKSDLSSQQVVAHDLAQDYAMSVGAKHFITSAFNNEGVQQVFVYIAQCLVKQQFAQQRHLEESDVFTLHESAARSNYLANQNIEGSTDEPASPSWGCACSIV